MASWCSIDLEGDWTAVDAATCCRAARLIALRAWKNAEARLAGIYRSRFVGNGLEFAELAKYTPGNQARYIQWPISMRKGQILVKRFQEERETPMLLAVDASASMRHQRGTWLAVIQVVATIAACAMLDNAPLGLVLGAAGWQRKMPIVFGRHRLTQIVAELLKVGIEPRGTDLAGLLKSAKAMSPPRSRVLLVSDMLDDGFAPILSELASRREVLLCRVHHDVSRFPAGMEVEDAETGLSAVVNAPVEVHSPECPLTALHEIHLNCEMPVLPQLLRQLGRSRRIAGER